MTATKKRVGFGRPTKYGEHIIERGYEYIETGYEQTGNVIPTLQGLGMWLNISSNTVHLWSKEHENFSRMLDELRRKQHDLLISNGLTGGFNPTIAKLVLAKHGYTDRVEQTIDHTTNGEQLQPAVFQGVSKEKVINPSTHDGWHAKPRVVKQDDHDQHDTPAIEHDQHDKQPAFKQDTFTQEPVKQADSEQKPRQRWRSRRQSVQRTGNV